MTGFVTFSPNLGWLPVKTQVSLAVLWNHLFEGYASENFSLRSPYVRASEAESLLIAVFHPNLPKEVMFVNIFLLHPFFSTLYSS